MTDEIDMIFKVLLVGDSGVGKTNMTMRYLDDKFNEHNKSTIGVEFGNKIYDIEGKKIKAIIWDTAGQERYRSITSAYYRGAQGALVVYDITRKPTFDSVERWINDLKTYADSDLIIMVIGNKSDLTEERAVTEEEGELKAKNFNVAFMETSAQNGNNISKAFDEIIHNIYNVHKVEVEKQENDKIIEESKNIDINNENINDQHKTKCC